MTGPGTSSTDALADDLLRVRAPRPARLQRDLDSADAALEAIAQARGDAGAEHEISMPTFIPALHARAVKAERELALALKDPRAGLAVELEAHVAQARAEGAGLSGLERIVGDYACSVLLEAVRLVREGPRSTEVSGG